MRKMFAILGLVWVFAIGMVASLAQTTDSGAVQIFFVACDTQAIVNLTGNMPAGYDVYFQLFSGAGGTGNALSSQRQAQVNGPYAFSEAVAYNSGSTVAAGIIASLKVSVAREGNPGSSTFTTTVDDVQDGCNNPQNPLATSVDAGAISTAVAVSADAILSPFGGVINPPAPASTPQPLVVIGPRQPDEPGRSQTPGVIFAECNQYMERANPGVLYDTDNITIFWSWFARTPELVQQHIDHALHAVVLNDVALPVIQTSPIQNRGGRNHWVFYTAQIGNLRPGFYRVNMNLIWDETINDGYDEYGPETDNPVINGSCTFEIKQNPYGVTVTDDKFNNLFKPQ